MAKKFQLRERGTNEKIYPITVKEAVGLDNVDNTSDVDKPVSTALAAAIAAAVEALDATVTSTDGTNVQVKVTETNGKITGVNITTDNTAKSSDLTAEVTRAKTAEAAIQATLDDHKADNDKKHIPEGGHERQLLAWKADGEAKWEDFTTVFTGLEELLAYGVEWDVNVADPHLTRIGNMTLHKTLPILSLLKGCIALGDKIMYWLNEDDWNYRKDPVYIQGEPGFDQKGTLQTTFNIENLAVRCFVGQKVRMILDYLGTSEIVDNGVISDITGGVATITWNEGTFDTGGVVVELGSDLSGYDGTVRVYCPNFYIKSQIIGDTRRVWLSTVKIDNTWTYQHEILIDAYRSTVLNTVPENMGYLSTLPVNSAISVVNTADYCRGGNNDASYDKYLEGVEASEGVEAVAKDIFRTELGKPATFISRPNMRLYSRNAGNEMLSYNQYKNIFYWLYVVEYANFNCQEAFNATLTNEGYHQGGMGYGVTTIGDELAFYNGYGPITPCGYGNDLGNRTGLKQIVTQAFMFEGSLYPSFTVQMPRWRGFDNPFGDIYTNLDGIVIERTTGLSNVWTTNDPTEYTDVVGNKTLAGHECLGEEFYIRNFDLGETAEIIPSANGGGADTTLYKCDWHTNEVFITSGLRTLYIGGCATEGEIAGLGCFRSNGNVLHSDRDIGFRTVSSFVSFYDSEG